MTSTHATLWWSGPSAEPYHRYRGPGVNVVCNAAYLRIAADVTCAYDSLVVRNHQPQIPGWCRPQIASGSWQPLQYSRDLTSCSGTLQFQWCVENNLQNVLVLGCDLGITDQSSESSFYRSIGREFQPDPGTEKRIAQCTAWQYVLNITWVTDQPRHWQLNTISWSDWLDQHASQHN